MSLFSSLLPNGIHRADGSEESNHEAQIVRPAGVVNLVDTDVAVEQADNKGNNNYETMPQPRPESRLVTGTDSLIPSLIPRRAP